MNEKQDTPSKLPWLIIGVVLIAISVIIIGVCTTTITNPDKPVQIAGICSDPDDPCNVALTAETIAGIKGEPGEQGAQGATQIEIFLLADESSPPTGRPQGGSINPITLNIMPPSGHFTLSTLPETPEGQIVWASDTLVNPRVHTMDYVPIWSVYYEKGSDYRLSEFATDAELNAEIMARQALQTEVNTNAGNIESNTQQIANDRLAIASNEGRITVLESGGGGSSGTDMLNAVRARLDAIEADGWVTGRRHRALSIGGGLIVDNFLEDRHVPDDFINQDMMEVDSIGLSEHRSNSVGSEEIINGEVRNEDLHTEVRDDIESAQTTATGAIRILTALEDALPENFPTAEGKYVLNVPSSGRRTWTAETVITPPEDPATWAEADNTDPIPDSKIANTPFISVEPGQFTRGAVAQNFRVVMHGYRTSDNPRVDRYLLRVQGVTIVNRAWTFANGDRVINIGLTEAQARSAVNNASASGATCITFQLLFYAGSTLVDDSNQLCAPLVAPDTSGGGSSVDPRTIQSAVACSDTAGVPMVTINTADFTNYDDLHFTVWEFSNDQAFMASLNLATLNANNSLTINLGNHGARNPVTITWTKSTGILLLGTRDRFCFAEVR